MQQIEEYILEEDFEPKTVKDRDSFKAKFLSKIKAFLESPYYLVTLIILVAAISFLLGRISKMGEAKQPVRVISENLSVSDNPLNPPYTKGETGKNSPAPGTSQTASALTSGVENNIKVVGSKNGTKYHLESCPGAKQISEKNKIVFDSIEDARSRGYTPATNCKGLK